MPSLKRFVLFVAGGIAGLFLLFYASLWIPWWIVHMDAWEAQALMEEELSPGDPAEEIEAFLERQGWPYDFDRFQQRYQSHDPESRTRGLLVEWVLCIYVYVDESKAFRRAEAEVIGTSM